MQKTTTIRVTEATRDKLNELARRRGTPAGDLVTALVDEADDRALLVAAAADWQRIAEDPVTLSAYRAEAGELDGFDSTLPEY